MRVNKYKRMGLQAIAKGKTVNAAKTYLTGEGAGYYEAGVSKGSGGYAKS